LLNIIERQAYISAIQCLHSKPSIYQDLVPSSGSLFEDFAALHKLQTPYVHRESQFLPWHRAFVWTFETTLRNECNYTGAQPYWDYGHDADMIKSSGRDFWSSEIFDPEIGFGGDGEMMKDNDYPGRPPNMPLGIGGGCVMTGPFSKDKFKLQLAKGDKLGPADPRCLTRMINPKVLKDWCGHEVEEAMKRTKSYKEFYQNMQGNSLDYNQFWGLHLCGHLSVT
jgi:tyrosinase